MTESLTPNNYPPPVPSVEEYKDALTRTRMTVNQKQMLKFQYLAPNHTVTATSLADAVGFAGWQGANLQYGLLGTRLRETLEYWEDGQQSYVLSYIIIPDRSRQEEWLFIMHEEVVQALRELQWFDEK